MARHDHATAGEAMRLGLGLGLSFPQRASGGPHPPVGWVIELGDGAAEIVSAPAAIGAWAITPGDASADFTTHPEFA